MTTACDATSTERTKTTSLAWQTEMMATLDCWISPCLGIPGPPAPHRFGSLSRSTLTGSAISLPRFAASAGSEGQSPSGQVTSRDDHMTHHMGCVAWLSHSTSRAKCARAACKSWGAHTHESSTLSPQPHWQPSTHDSVTRTRRRTRLPPTHPITQTDDHHQDPQPQRQTLAATQPRRPRLQVARAPPINYPNRAQGPAGVLLHASAPHAALSSSSLQRPRGEGEARRS
eukprot:3048807-Rhodomonas_salina.1